MMNCMTEVSKCPSEEQAQETIQRYIYNGASMNPTFRAGSILYVRPQARELAVGDVIVYSDTETKENIVHRVVSVRGEQVITRGDHNPSNDLLPVQPAQILGKVERVHDGVADKSVRGGQVGWWVVQFQRTLRRFVQVVKRLLGMPYRLFRRSGIAARIWKPGFVKVSFLDNGVRCIKYIHRQRTVAIWYPSQRQFECRKPYDLVLRPPD
jgi:signal peptidase I